MNHLLMLASMASEMAREAREQAEPPIADDTLAILLLVPALLCLAYWLYKHHRRSA